MNIVVPNYYKKFQCIADKCRHTCCVGWEIDVDEVSLERFKEIPEIIKEVRDGSFVLDSEERCPFLEKSGLCRMILKYGEDMLCDICKDHPRFRNFYDDRIEMGLGLTCEAACKLIIDNEEPFGLVSSAGKIVEMDETIVWMTGRDRGILERLDGLFVSELGSAERAQIFYELERLDEAWTVALEGVMCEPVGQEERRAFVAANPVKFEQLAVYFLYRHEGNARFAVECVNLVADLCVRGLEIYDAARMLSSESEYSDTNIDILLYEEFFWSVDD